MSDMSDKKKNKDLQDVENYTKSRKPKADDMLSVSPAMADRLKANRYYGRKVEDKSKAAYQKSYVAKGEKASTSARRAALEMMAKKKMTPEWKRKNEYMEMKPKRKYN